MAYRLGWACISDFPRLFGTTVIVWLLGFHDYFFVLGPNDKATRVWGGAHSQGRAFGFLDGGRGLVGALFGLLGVLVFSGMIGNDSSGSSAAVNQNAFAYVIYSCSFLVAVIGIFVWRYLKFERTTDHVLEVAGITIGDIRTVLKLPAVTLLMVIILCAYVGYKITDVLSLYAADVMRYDQAGAAELGTFLLSIRPVVA